MANQMSPAQWFEDHLPEVIEASPSVVTRTREIAVDTFREPVVFTAGPYVVRVEPITSLQVQEIWDEKGNVARLLFVLLGYDIPVTVQEGSATLPTFRVDDILTDADGNKYRVVAPQFVRGKMVQVTLELRG